MSLFRSAATVALITLFSRFFGFARDVVIARFIGAASEADLFFFALQFPNSFRRIFAEGAFNYSFVPTFIYKLEHSGRVIASAFANRLLSVLTSFLLVLVLAGQLASPVIVTLFAPGYSAVQATRELAVDLLQITFPYLLLISLTAAISGAMNAMNHFAAAAATPILFNAGIIAGAVLISSWTETVAHGMSYGLVLGGIAQLVFISVAGKRAGLTLRLPAPRLTRPVKVVLIRMAPAAIAAGVTQINLIINTLLSTLLGEGAVSHLYYASRMMELPVGILAITLGTTLLPLISRHISRRDEPGANHAINRAIEFGLLIALPAAVSLAIIPLPIMRTLFEYGAFGTSDSLQAAAALAAYAPAIPAFLVVRGLLPAYHARHDTLSPLWVSVIAILVNILFNLVAMRIWGHVGLAIGFSLSGWIQALLLGGLLFRRNHFHLDSRTTSHCFRMLGASAVMAVSLYLLAGMISEWFGMGAIVRFLGILLLVSAGLVIYTVAAILFRAFHVHELVQELQAIRSSRRTAPRMPDNSGGSGT